MKFDGIVTPIKMLRAATRASLSTSVDADSTVVAVRLVGGGGWSLKEAKDFVEACMAMGAARERERRPSDGR
jgi:hypothetical protein